MVKKNGLREMQELLRREEEEVAGLFKELERAGGMEEERDTFFLEKVEGVLEEMAARGDRFLKEMQGLREGADLERHTMKEKTAAEGEERPTAEEVESLKDLLQKRQENVSLLEKRLQEVTFLLESVSAEKKALFSYRPGTNNEARFVDRSG